MDNKVYRITKYAKMINDIYDNKDTLNSQNQTNSLDNLVDIISTGIIRLELRNKEKQAITENQDKISSQNPIPKKENQNIIPNSSVVGFSKTTGLTTRQSYDKIKVL